MHVLVNWLAQGAAVTMVVAAGVRLHRRISAATRERVWWLALIAVASMPLVAVLREFAIAARPSAAATLSLADPLIAVQPSSSQLITAAIAVWAAWTIASLARVGLDLFQLVRAKQLAASFPGSRERSLSIWTGMRSHGRGAVLVVSTQVRHAAVLGLWRPMIAVAPETLAQLTDDELDQVVLHEYAHVQRRDDIFVVAQRIIVALAGWHPAVWWLDRQLTIDREIACDDWVIACSGGRTGYARCLVKLASQGLPHGWSIAPGALRSRSQLAVRVAALVNSRREPAVTSSKSTLRVALPAVASLAVISVCVPLFGVLPDLSAPLISRSFAAAATLIATEPPAPVNSQNLVNPVNPRNLGNLGNPGNPENLGNRGNLGNPVEFVNSVDRVNPEAERLPSTILAQLDLQVGSPLPLNPIVRSAASPWAQTASFFSRAGRSFSRAGSSIASAF